MKPVALSTTPAFPEQASRFFDALLNKSFTEVCSTTHKAFDFQIAPTTLKEIEGMRWQSFMLTMASSHFKIISLVHFPAYKTLDAAYRNSLSEHAESDEKYQDFISETGNNLCGVACNMMGERGFSTGLSTPTLIQNRDASNNIHLIEVDYETHVCGLYQGGHQLCVSFYVFTDRLFTVDDRMQTSELEVSQNTGELEFF